MCHALKQSPSSVRDLLVFVLILTTALGGSTCYVPSFANQKRREGSENSCPFLFLQISFEVTHTDFVILKVALETSG